MVHPCGPTAPTFVDLYGRHPLQALAFPRRLSPLRPTSSRRPMSADARSESSIATTEVDADTTEVEADTSEEATTVKDEPGASSTPGDGEMSPFSRCLELWNMPILSPQVPVEPAPRRPVPVEPEPQRPTAVSLEERWDATRVAARGLPIAFYFVPDEDLEGHAT